MQVSQTTPLRKKRLPSYVVRGIFLSLSKGEELVHRHPEVADEWRAGNSEAEIGKRYFPQDRAHVSRNAVHYALKILIPDDEERANIAESHVIEGRRRYTIQR